MPVSAQDYPRTWSEFLEWFSSEEACLSYLERLRWPHGFACPDCASMTAPYRASRTRLMCHDCGRQSTVTAGTIFDKTRTPLKVWLAGAWYLTSQKQGVSALGLQRVLGLGSYQTAWTMLHRFRCAMVRPDRERLKGLVEVDETYLAISDRQRPISPVGRKSSTRKVLVVMAVEILEPKGFGRIRLRRILNDSDECVVPFVQESVEPGARVRTDGSAAYRSLKELGYTHERTVMLGSDAPAHVSMAGVHRVLDWAKVQGYRSGDNPAAWKGHLSEALLMCTDPGDLVLDPTCGSGTTAYVAEKWGRRWITCDTSRVAVTLAKQRLMTASYDYFALRYPHEGLKGGFIYKTVPRVTLKSIANNPEIDAIYERLHPGIEAVLAEFNNALAVNPPAVPYVVSEGARKGQKLALGIKGVRLLEWEMPFDYPAGWEEEARTLFAGFHDARQSMQAEMDRSIAAQADNETLYDQPEKTKNKLRITGPFTVEAVPFPTVLSLGEQSAQVNNGLDANIADMSVARSGNTSRQHTWRDELLKAGIRGKGGQMLKFAELEVLPGTTCLHATGHLIDTGERVVISFGPEHGALEPRQVDHALNEAQSLRPSAKYVIFCAFNFDPEAAKDIDETNWPGVTLLKAQMNTDLLTEDLKKASSKSTTNQSFWLMGQPDVHLTALPDGLWQVEVNGFDYFDTAKGELVSGGKTKIAAWSLDTDYDGRSLFPHQFFFPMAGKDEGWMKLKKDIRAELDEDLLKHFVGTVSLPFEAGANNTVAIKIVDDRGIESLKVMKLVAATAAG